MRYTSLLILAVFGFSEIAIAGITFELAPNNQQAPQGSTMTFTLSLSSTELAGEGVNSVDFNVNAGAGDGSGGVFVIPTSTVILGNGPIDLSTPGQAFGTNTQGSNLTIPNSGVLLANLYLDTTGVSPGIYQMTLDSLAANQSGFGALPVFDSTISYEVLSAVPEPSSMLTALTLGTGALFYRRKRRELCS